MAEWIEAGELASLGDPGARGVRVPGREGVPLFVVHKAGTLAAYRNACPHTGAPLEWMPDRFLDMDNSFIQCALHGALFRVGDGYCLRGPCARQSLEALPVRLEDGRIWVDVSALSRADGGSGHG